VQLVSEYKLSATLMFFNVTQNTAIAHDHAVQYYLIQIVFLLQKPMQQKILQKL